MTKETMIRIGKVAFWWNIGGAVAGCVIGDVLYCGVSCFCFLAVDRLLGKLEKLPD